jgi:hypothetical protein
MTEKKGEGERKHHCACARGDLSAIQPGTAPLADDTTATPDGSKPWNPAAAVAPDAVEHQETRG